MTRPLALAVAAAVVACAMAWAAAAHAQACGNRAQMVERLAAKYGEAFAGGGLRDGSTIFEVWVARDTGTWTILMTQASGVACIMASGSDWRDALPAEVAVPAH